MDGGQGPVRPKWPLFGGIGGHGSRLIVNDETPCCRSIYLGIGKGGILLYLQGANGKPRLLAADGGRADTARDFSAQQADDGSTGKPPHTRTGVRNGLSVRDGLLAATAPEGIRMRLGRQRIPFGIVASHPVGPRGSFRRIGHSLSGSTKAFRYPQFVDRIHQQSPVSIPQRIREELRVSGFFYQPVGWVEATRKPSIINHEGPDYSPVGPISFKGAAQSAS